MAGSFNTSYATFYPNPNQIHDAFPLMSDSSHPTFLVSAYSEPVVVRINGKANYMNCNKFREFMETMIQEGKQQFVLDFKSCKGMDSTFLGILAGCALGLRKQDPPGLLVICNLGERNHELICNLGLQHLLTIGDDLPLYEGNFSKIDESEVSNAKEVLKAHQNLVKADEENAAKFQDVIAFLQNQVEADNSN